MVLMLVTDLLRKNFVGDGARVNREAGVVADAADLVAIPPDCLADQFTHLPVAVLLDHVDALHAFHKVQDVIIEGERPDAEVGGGNILFAAQLVAAFDDRPVRAAEGDDPDLGSGVDRKSTRLNSSHIQKSRMPSSA